MKFGICLEFSFQALCGVKGLTESSFVILLHEYFSSANCDKYRPFVGLFIYAVVTVGEQPVTSLEQVK